jgi:hypothetical protein
MNIMNCNRRAKVRILFFAALLTTLPFIGSCGHVRNPKDNVNALITKDGLKNIQIALELYRREYGEYPDTLEELMLKKGITRKDIIEDAWGQKYYYVRLNDSYILFSMGKDKKPHTMDDIYYSP